MCHPDLGDEATRVLVQYDGAVHAGWAARERDLQRHELARAAGWEVVVVTARDLRRPEHLVARVAAAYERAAQRRRGAGR